MKKKTTLIFTMIILLIALTATVFAYIALKASDPDRIITPDPDEYAISVVRLDDYIGKSLVPTGSVALRTNESLEIRYEITVYSNIRFIFQLGHNLPEQFSIGVETGFGTGTFVPIEESFQTNSGYNDLTHEGVTYQYAVIFRVSVTLLELHDDAFHDLIFTVNPTGTIED